jgi:hypothetical protein
LEYYLDVNGGSIRQNFKTSAKRGLGYNELNSINHEWMKIQNYQIKGIRLNCNGFRIQIK